jgi:aminoglycoside 6'-N-acetyltransferase
VSELRGEIVVLRPLEQGDGERLREIRRHPEVHRFWGALEDDFPWEDEPDTTRYTILAGGEVAGMVQFSEESEPDYRHAEIDVFVDPAVRGRGHGPDAVRTLADHLVRERGHHRIVIGAAVENTAALRAYEKAGFARIGLSRLSWRDPDGRWHDEVLMERVEEGLVDSAG